MTPNHALQRTAPCVTAPASAAAFPPTMQVPRRTPLSLSLRSLGVWVRSFTAQAQQELRELPTVPASSSLFGFVHGFPFAAFSAQRHRGRGLGCAGSILFGRRCGFLLALRAEFWFDAVDEAARPELVYSAFAAGNINT